MTIPSPLAAVHEQHGATFTEFSGWSMPVRYGSDLNEHHAVRRRAGLFDLSHMGEIEIRGTDAAAMLDHALVGHLSAVGVDRARYTMLCDDDGGVLDDLVVYRRAADRYLVVANAGNTRTVHRELVARASGFDVEVDDLSLQMALLALQGPAAAGVLAELTSADLEGLRFYASVDAEVAGIEVLLARTGYTGEDGFELYCDPDDAAELWQALLTAGSDAGVVPCGLAARDTLRLEAGMPLYGHELGVERTPFDAGLGRVVKFDKPGDFVGREALAVLAEKDPDQLLVGLIAEGRRAPRPGYEIRDGSGSRVGVVTSGAPSPTLGEPIAMAYVDAACAAVDTQLVVDVRGTPVDARVVDLPFYRRTS